jgi:hypothetical protein
LGRRSQHPPRSQQELKYFLAKFEILAVSNLRPCR